jgi:hypothetical protein
VHSKRNFLLPHPPLWKRLRTEGTRRDRQTERERWKALGMPQCKPADYWQLILREALTGDGVENTRIKMASIASGKWLKLLSTVNLVVLIGPAVTFGSLGD